MVAIALQVGNMCVSIKQFDELTKTLSAQDMERVGKWYTTYVFITLRRLVDNDKDAISFARLLRDLTQKTGLLTRARYCDMFWDGLHISETPILPTPSIRSNLGNFRITKWSKSVFGFSRN